MKNNESDMADWSYKKGQAIPQMEMVIDDGGRREAGFKGKTGDCVVRAIAIAANMDYREVYDELFKRNKEFAEGGRCKVAKSLKKKGGTPRNGNFKKVYDKYLKELGFRWVPTMFVGQGAKVHLRPDEYPRQGRTIARLSKHLCAVIDGVVHDTYDPSRGGTRTVYGYYIKED